MIIETNRQRGSATRRASGFVDYVTSGVTCNGEKRLAAPIHYFGAPTGLWAETCNIYARRSQNPVTTLNLCFSEYVGSAALWTITTRVNAMITIGLDPADILVIAVSHVKTSAATGQPSTDAHLAYLNCLLSSGRRWQPFYDRADRRLFVATAEEINLDFGLTSPKDPKRRRDVVCQPHPRDTPAVKAFKKDLEHSLARFVREGRLRHASEVAKYVESRPEIDRVEFNVRSARVHLRDGFSFSITGPIAYADFERERLEKLRLEEMRARKTREEYQADLLEGLRRRESRHSALYLNTRRRCIGLPCLELLWSVRQRLALEAGLASKKRTPI